MQLAGLGSYNKLAVIQNMLSRFASGSKWLNQLTHQISQLFYNSIDCEIDFIQSIYSNNQSMRPFTIKVETACHHQLIINVQYRQFQLFNWSIYQLRVMTYDLDLGPCMPFKWPDGMAPGSSCPVQACHNFRSTGPCILLLLPCRPNARTI